MLSCAAHARLWLQIDLLSLCLRVATMDLHPRCHSRFQCKLPDVLPRLRLLRILRALLVFRLLLQCLSKVHTVVSAMSSTPYTKLKYQCYLQVFLTFLSLNWCDRWTIAVFVLATTRSPLVALSIRWTGIGFQSTDIVPIEINQRNRVRMKYVEAGKRK